MNIESHEAFARALKGAKRLDVLRPGWRKSIALAKLDIDDPRYCILGQIYGSYAEGLDAVFALAPIPAGTAMDHGFVCSYVDRDTFTEAWKRVISLPVGEEVPSKFTQDKYAHIHSVVVAGDEEKVVYSTRLASAGFQSDRVQLFISHVSDFMESYGEKENYAVGSILVASNGYCFYVGNKGLWVLNKPTTDWLLNKSATEWMSLDEVRGAYGSLKPLKLANGEDFQASDA